MAEIQDPFGLLARRPELREPLQRMVAMAGGPDGPHSPNDSSPSFTDGVAWAAHMMRHAIGMAHDRFDREALRAAIPDDCCRTAVISYVAGFAASMANHFGHWTPHRHPGMPR